MQFAWWKYPIHWLAYGFGLGKIPGASGTFGTVLAIPVFVLMSRLGPVPYVAIVAGLFIAGIFICGQTAHDLGLQDPGATVYDEIVGFLVAMYLLPRDWRWVAAGRPRGRCPRRPAGWRGDRPTPSRRSRSSRSRP